MYHTEQDNYFKWCPTEKTPNQSSDNRHYSPTVDLKNLIPVARYNSTYLLQHVNRHQSTLVTVRVQRLKLC